MEEASSDSAHTDGVSTVSGELEFVEIRLEVLVAGRAIVGANPAPLEQGLFEVSLLKGIVGEMSFVLLNVLEVLP